MGGEFIATWGIGSMEADERQNGKQSEPRNLNEANQAAIAEHAQSASS